MLEKTFLPKSIENKFYQKWEKGNFFRSGEKPEADPYVIMMPPPNVTGSLHMGHALTYTLQDILIRYQRMLGRDVLWQPGMDHAGIATQSVVERQLSTSQETRQKLGREEFVKRIWKWKEESGGTILSQQRQLGLSPDWEKSRFTLDEGLNKAVRHVFVELYKSGLIYRAKRLVNWDSHLQTAVSDLEVKSVEVKGKLYYIQYAVSASQETITIATTRPETLFADTAIAVHPEDERYQHLIGKHAIVPLQNRVVPIISDDYCDPLKGTGAVKISPAHDFNDFEMAQRHSLDIISIFDMKACLNTIVPFEFQNLDRFSARTKVIESLKSLNILEKNEDIIHAVPHSERSQVILEPFLTDQWFVDAKTLAGPALEAMQNGETQILPQQWTATYYHWLNNIHPWCISRQLWWGHQIPAWFGPDGHIFVAHSLEEAASQALTHYGQQVNLKQDEDVLDTWFSSALWPFSTLGWPEKTLDLQRYYPTSVLITGLDILFFWVARMMMMSLHFMKEVPFKTVYLHALVKDEQGQKMSKSKGNVINPIELIEDYGADALRFSMAALTAPARDVKFSLSTVQGYRNFATKFWNASRFCLQNNCFFQESFDPLSSSLGINRWIIAQVIKLAQTLENELDQYHFNISAAALYQMIWGKFCDWYLEFIKPILSGDDQQAKIETQNCAGWCLGMICHLLHPFMPFITEEIWEKITRNEKDLLIGSSWPFQHQNYNFILEDKGCNNIEWIIDLISTLRALRATLNVSPSVKLTLGLKAGNSETQLILKSQYSLIERLGRIEKLEFQSQIPAGSAQFVYKNETFFIPLKDIIDLDQERQRLQKIFDQTEKDLKELQRKLQDKDFRDKAPDYIIEKNQDRITDLKETYDRLKQALISLKN